MALSEKGLFAAFSAIKWPWLDEKIMEQPCYTSPFAIKDEVTMASDVTGRKNPPEVAGASKILYGIFTSKVILYPKSVFTYDSFDFFSKKRSMVRSRAHGSTYPPL